MSAVVFQNEVDEVRAMQIRLLDRVIVENFTTTCEQLLTSLQSESLQAVILPLENFYSGWVANESVLRRYFPTNPDSEFQTYVAQAGRIRRVQSILSLNPSGAEPASNVMLSSIGGQSETVSTDSHTNAPSAGSRSTSWNDVITILRTIVERSR